MVETRGPWLSSTTALFLVWAGLTLAVRVWAKLQIKKWGPDDYAVSVAYASNIVHVAMIYRAIDKGYGSRLGDISQDEVVQIQQVLYASQLLYVFSAGMCRTSCAFFIKNLSISKRQVWLSYILAISSVVWTVVSLFVIALRNGGNQPWTVMDGSASMHLRWIGIESSGLIIEVALWLLPMQLLWNLQMRLKKRIYLLCAFGFRLLIIPIVTFRLLHLSPSLNTAPTFTSIIANIFTEAALEFYIISASVTCLKPFLRSLHPTYVLSSNEITRSGGQSLNQSRNKDHYYRLEAISTPKMGSISEFAATQNTGVARNDGAPNISTPPEARLGHLKVKHNNLRGASSSREGLTLNVVSRDTESLHTLPSHSNGGVSRLEPVPP